MARKNRQGLRKKFVYFFLNGKLHKVLKLSRAKDELIAWCYLDKKRMMYSYSQVDKNMEKAYTVIEVSKILGRHRVTIEEYILQGKIKQPQKMYPISNPDSKWSKYMLSESDILDIHQFIIDAGHIRDCMEGGVMAETRVKVDLSFTRNLGNYESIRINIGVEDDVRNGENVDSATERVYTFVENKLIEKTREVEQELKNGK